MPFSLRKTRSMKHSFLFLIFLLLLLLCSLPRSEGRGKRQRSRRENEEEIRETSIASSRSHAFCLIGTSILDCWPLACTADLRGRARVQHPYPDSKGGCWGQETGSLMSFKGSKVREKGKIAGGGTDWCPSPQVTSSAKEGTTCESCDSVSNQSLVVCKQVHLIDSLALSLGLSR